MMPKFNPELFKTSVLNFAYIHSKMFIYPALLEKLFVDVLCVSVVLSSKKLDNIFLTRSKKANSKSAFLY